MIILYLILIPFECGVYSCFFLFPEEIQQEQEMFVQRTTGLRVKMSVM